MKFVCYLHPVKGVASISQEMSGSVYSLSYTTSRLQTEDVF